MFTFAAPLASLSLHYKPAGAGTTMTAPDFRSRIGSFARADHGSAPVALAAFLAALVALGAMAGLHAAGILSVPPLVFLILAIVTLYTGWDAWRERRRSRGD